MSAAAMRARMWNDLRRAYQARHADDQLLGVVCDDQSVVIQFLRIHVVPAECVADEFERHIQLAGSQFERLTHRQFARDRRRWFRLRAEQRRQVQRQIEIQLHGSHGTAHHADGYGDEVEALCFDTRTRMYQIYRGRGTHKRAADWVYEQVRCREVATWPLNPDQRRVDYRERSQDFVMAFVLTLPGWSVPFLQLLSWEPRLSRTQRRQALEYLWWLERWIVVEASS